MEAVHAVNGQMPAGPLLQLAAAAGGTDAIGQTLGGMLEIGGIDINSSAAAHLTGYPSRVLGSSLETNIQTERQT